MKPIDLLPHLGLEERSQLRRIAKESGSTPAEVGARIVSLYLQGLITKPEKMTKYEKAEAVSLVEDGLTHAQVAAKLGRSRHAIYRAVRFTQRSASSPSTAVKFLRKCSKSLTSGGSR